MNPLPAIERWAGQNGFQAKPATGAGSSALARMNSASPLLIVCPGLSAPTTPARHGQSSGLAGRRRFLDYLAVLERLVRDAAKAAGKEDAPSTRLRIHPA